MKRTLTFIEEPTRMVLAGETEAGSVEVQPARDSQPKATNCHWDRNTLDFKPIYFIK